MDCNDNKLKFSSGDLATNLSVKGMQEVYLRLMLKKPFVLFAYTAPTICAGY
jgi:hypothetical protein